MPALSVVMPVHNALPFLDEAVESILRQSFRDFEFVILDDASTDGSTERLRRWAAQDARIRLIEADENLGPVGSSNMVARAARAPFVARMDGDDISHPNRLAEQLRLLRENPDVGLVGSASEVIDVSGRKTREPELWRLVRRSVFVPFAHGGFLADVRPELAASSVYVLPSYREGTPRSVLEAMSMGRAIITTDAPGCRETVNDGENGILVPPRDADALYGAMLRFVDDPELAGRMGAESRRLAESKYEVGRINATLMRYAGLC